MSATKVSIGVCEMLRASIWACASRGNWASADGCNCRSRNLSAPRLENSWALDGLAPQVMRLSKLRSWALRVTASSLRASEPGAPAAAAAVGQAKSNDATAQSPKWKPISVLFQQTILTFEPPIPPQG